MSFPAAIAFLLFAADLGDILTVVAGLLFVLVPVIGQLLANANKGNQPGRPQGGNPPPANPGVDREVAEFLRRVAEKQPGGDRGANAGARPPVQQPQPQGRPGPDRVQPARSLPPRPGVRQVEPPRPVVPAQVVQAEAAVPKKPADRLGTSKRFGTLSRLGADVDERLRQEELLRGKKFSRSGDGLKERRLREGASKKEAERARGPLPAVDWAAMLGNVADVRQAIVMSEILQRPEHRWS